MSQPDTTAKIRLLLVDDHTLLRQGMRQLLEQYPHLHVVDEASDGEEAVLKALTLKPDIILMDITMPKLSGYEASKAIFTVWPQAKILILTNQDDKLILKKLLELPIMGYCLKDVDTAELVAQLEGIHAGDKQPLSAELAEKLNPANRKTEPGMDALTERESDVLSALAQGHTNQQLADLLCVSPKTVNNHLYSIYSKIGVANRSEAIVWAIKNGYQ